mgnify:CR=1 FL=1
MISMIDLNPYFRKKLGETLVFNHEHEKYLMEVIATCEVPNSVYLETSSLPQQTGEHIWKYHGVFEIDLNLVGSVRAVKEAVVFCLKNDRSTAKARKLNN